MTKEEMQNVFSTRFFCVADPVNENSICANQFCQYQDLKWLMLGHANQYMFTGVKRSYRR